MKIVIDTNVVVSALFFGGKPQELLRHAITGAFDVFVSKEIVKEYNEAAIYLKRSLIHQLLFSITKTRYIKQC